MLMVMDVEWSAERENGQWWKPGKATSRRNNEPSPRSVVKCALEFRFKFEIWTREGEGGGGQSGLVEKRVR